MFWARSQNVAAMLAAIEVSAGAGAQIVVLSELAMTGFHREIGREADASKLPSDREAIQDAARRQRVAVVFGAPTFDAGQERPFNSHVHLGRDGAVRAVASRRGLTPGEASRPSSRLFGATCSLVLCREGELLFTLPRNASGLAVFRPGDSAYRWMPLPA